jgi:hypothetical protein
MDRITTAAAARLPDEQELRLGFVVLPHNVSSPNCIDIMDDLILEAYRFQHPYRLWRPGDLTCSFDSTIIESREAVKRAFNLTDRDWRSCGWFGCLRSQRAQAEAASSKEIFLDEERRVLILSYESDYLEVAHVCFEDYGLSNCWGPDGQYWKPEALTELGELSIRSRARQHNSQQDQLQVSVESLSQERAVEVLSEGIAAFIERTLFDGPEDNLQAVVLTGGASDLGILEQAARKAIPSLDDWRFLMLEDPAFAQSLGAAAESRLEFLRLDKGMCHCGASNEFSKRGQGWPTDEEYPCDRPWF